MKYFNTWIDLIAERNIKPTDKVTLQLGIDDGGGFLKICGNFIVERSDTPNFPKSSKHMKARHHSRYKESSVKHSLILAIVEDIPEVNAILELIC